jgi:hypothetical protein
MLYINNCKNGIVSNNSEFRVVAGVFINSIRDLAIGINSNSYLESVAGAPGATIGIYITDCKRGIAVGNNSSANVSNAWLNAVSYGVSVFDASSFRFDNSSIVGVGTGSTTQPAGIVGAFLDTGSNASFFNTSVTGFTNGTGGATQAHYQCNNFSVLHHGSTTQATLISLVPRSSGGTGGLVVISGFENANLIPEVVIAEPKVNVFNV